MNKIVEQFNITDEYWGDKKKYKFRVRIGSFDNQTEMEREVNELLEHHLQWQAYLLPTEFDNKPTTIKEYTPKRVVFGYEKKI